MCPKLSPKQQQQQQQQENKTKQSKTKRKYYIAQKFYVLIFN